MTEKFTVEVNGPVNILALLDLAEYRDQAPDVEAIRQQAKWTIDYLQALGRGERLAWNQMKGKP